MEKEKNIFKKKRRSGRGCGVECYDCFLSARLFGKLQSGRGSTPVRIPFNLSRPNTQHLMQCPSTTACNIYRFGVDIIQH